MKLTSIKIIIKIVTLHSKGNTKFFFNTKKKKKLK